MKSAACAYARRGWAVHPLNAEDGRPLLAKDRDPVTGEPIPNTGGVYKASADASVVAAWWAKWPTARIAVATGAPLGAFALDIDRKGEVDGFASLAALEARFGEPLPRTWRARTPSGGEHRYFRQPHGVALRNKVGLRLYQGDGSRTDFPGLDIRSTGASITIPPSRKPSGAYVWIDRPSQVPLADAPAWLLELAEDRPPPARHERPAPRLQSADRAARYVERAIEAECGAVANTPPNTGRNLRLFQAAANLGELVGADLLRRDDAERALELAAQDCGLHTDDGGWEGIRQTIASGLSRGIAKPREVQL